MGKPKNGKRAFLKKNPLLHVSSGVFLESHTVARRNSGDGEHWKETEVVREGIGFAPLSQCSIRSYACAYAMHMSHFAHAHGARTPGPVHRCQLTVQT
eukprot:2075930-Amphidinium_carterae.1